MRDKQSEGELCRLCSSEHRQGVTIFSSEGREMRLQENISKYLRIEVKPEDALPGLVCRECLHRLCDVERFASQALEAQERLRNLLLPPADIATDQKKSVEKNAEETWSAEVVPEVEAMEVRVDPMSFLQCVLDSAPEVESPGATATSAIPEVSDPVLMDEGQMFMLSCRTCQHVPTFSSLAALQAHCRSTHGSQRGAAQARCRICDRNVARLGRLAVHARRHGIIVQPYRCEGCTLSFCTRILLRRHRRNGCNPPRQQDSAQQHSILETYLLQNFCDIDSPRYECSLCGKQLSTKGNLKVHLETHRPKDDFLCGICNRTFKSPSSLSRHSEKHFEGHDLQFPCLECGRVYPSRSTLRVHSITHSDLRPHACSWCDKTFKRYQDLKFHMNQHTGARPYNCPFCPKAFASSGNCYSHRKRMHAQEIQQDHYSLAQ